MKRMILSESVWLMCVIAIVAAGCSSPTSDEPGAADAPEVEAPTAESDTPEAAAETESPEDVARGFMEANVAEDIAAFKGHLTAKAHESLDGDGGLSTESFESYSIGESAIDGDTAWVDVAAVQEGEEQAVKLLMRQEAGLWKIHGMEVSLGDGMNMTIDLESIGEMMESMAEGMGDAIAEGFQQAFETSPEELAAQHDEFESIAPVSEDAYNAMWRNAAEYEGEPAIVALAGISEAIGVPIDTRDIEALSAPVQSEVAGLSYPAAIERIANDAGLYTVFPDPPHKGGGMLGEMAKALAETMTQMLEQSGVDMSETDEELDSQLDELEAVIRFEEGTRPYPVQFKGPFVIEVAEVEENPPHGTGKFSLAVRTYGLSPTLHVMLENDTGSTVFHEIVDAKARSLIDDNIQYLGGGEAKGPIYVDKYSLDLRNLIREVETIASVKGSQRLLRPETVAEMTFTDIAQDQTVETDGLTATVIQTGTYTAFKVATPNSDATAMSAQAVAEDANGEPVEVEFTSTSAWQEDSLDLGINLASMPHTVHIKIMADTETHEYDFAFADIPLEKYAEMPEAIEELSFEGHDTPLSVEFIEVTEPDDSFAKVRIRVTNHSNKAATMLSMTFEYIDANGNKIDDFPSSISSPQKWVNNEFVETPIAEAGAAEEVDATAFNMSEGTEDVRCIVTQVEFVDGTSWSAF